MKVREEEVSRTTPGWSLVFWNVENGGGNSFEDEIKEFYLDMFLKFTNT